MFQEYANDRSIDGLTVLLHYITLCIFNVA